MENKELQVLKLKPEVQELVTSCNGDFFETNKIPNLGVIGDGWSGDVILSKYPDGSGKHAAMKMFSKSSNSKNKKICFETEVLVLSMIQAKNIVAMIDAFECPDTYVLVMPYYPRGSLDSHLTRLADLAKVRMFRQLMEAVMYLHLHHIAHLDIKPGNVLISSEGDAILTDFGLAIRVESKQERFTTFIGTDGFAAPEMKNGVRDDIINYFKCDAYSLGIVLWCLRASKLPSYDQTNFIGDPLLDCLGFEIHCDVMDHLLNENAKERWDCFKLSEEINKKSTHPHEHGIEFDCFESSRFLELSARELYKDVIGDGTTAPLETSQEEEEFDYESESDVSETVGQTPHDSIETILQTPMMPPYPWHVLPPLHPIAPQYPMATLPFSTPTIINPQETHASPVHEDEHMDLQRGNPIERSEISDSQGSFGSNPQSDVSEEIEIVHQTPYDYGMMLQQPTLPAYPFPAVPQQEISEATSISECRPNDDVCSGSSRGSFEEESIASENIDVQFVDDVENIDVEHIDQENIDIEPEPLDTHAHEHAQEQPAQTLSYYHTRTMPPVYPWSMFAPQPPAAHQPQPRQQRVLPYCPESIFMPQPPVAHQPQPEPWEMQAQGLALPRRMPQPVLPTYPGPLLMDQPPVAHQPPQARVLPYCPESIFMPQPPVAHQPQPQSFTEQGFRIQPFHPSYPFVYPVLRPAHYPTPMQ